MLRKTFFAAALSTLTGVALALPLAAEAGGGMGAGSGLTTCRMVLNAPNQPQIVSVTDGFIAGDEVRLGALVLLCDLPAVGVPNTDVGTAIPEAQRNAVACYLVNGADGARIPTTVSDPLTAVNTASGTQSVTLSAIQLLCLPAATTNP